MAGMRRSCAAASLIRAYAGSCVRVGRSTDEIDALVHAEVLRHGWYPSPLGYAGFPKSICTSVNQVVVHGIPDARRLEEGDIVNIDVSVYVEGFHGDCSGMVQTQANNARHRGITCALSCVLSVPHSFASTSLVACLRAQFVAGAADPLAAHLIETTRACMNGAIALCGPGVPFSAVGGFIQPMAEREGFSIVRQFCGHGIGRTFHMPPLVFHCGTNCTHSGHREMSFSPGFVLTSWLCVCACV